MFNHVHMPFNIMEKEIVTLPFEIIMRISQFSDDTTKYKIHSLLNYKVCCSYEEKIRNKTTEDYDNEQFYFCNICRNYICSTCYEDGAIFVDNCYRCDKSICTECNDCNLLKDIWIKRCDSTNCYYCSRGSCFGNKIEWCCEDCIYESDECCDLL
jgi:hypothetical protein